MQIQLREQRNVQQHDEPQEIVIRERGVQFVGQLDAPDGVVARVRLGIVEAQQLTGHADRIEHDESGVAAQKK